MLVNSALENYLVLNATKPGKLYFVFKKNPYVNYLAIMNNTPSKLYTMCNSV